ncbi:Cinnamyl-alcohol dehydrogenase, partial [Thalictrum thalictroides]
FWHEGDRDQHLNQQKGRNSQSTQLGADEFLVSCDPAQMQAAMGTLDGIIDTVSAKHPLLPLICLLKTGGKITMLA